MRIELDSAKLKFYIGDVRNHDFVCHAMAPKQVPSSEFNPMEGVRRTC